MTAALASETLPPIALLILVLNEPQTYTTSSPRSLAGCELADLARSGTIVKTNVKRTLLLGTTLCGIWLLWSGHLKDPLLLCLGLGSAVMVVTLAIRMRILDDEGAPIGLGFRPLLYAVWLTRKIVISNIEVTRLILDPKLPIRPRLVRVKANQKTELGRVILANSITLTPGTLSVDLRGDHIWVHALSMQDAEEDLSGDMDRRVCALER